MATAASRTKECLFFIRDQVSDQPFLADTSTAVSVYTSTDRHFWVQWPSPQCGKQYTHLHFGTCMVPLTINSCSFQWKFVIMDITKPLLCADFFCNHSLLIDMRGHQLHVVDATTFSTTPLGKIAGHTQHLCTMLASGL